MDRFFHDFFSWSGRDQRGPFFGGVYSSDEENHSNDGGSGEEGSNPRDSMLKSRRHSHGSVPSHPTQPPCADDDCGQRVDEQDIFRGLSPFDNFGGRQEEGFFSPFDERGESPFTFSFGFNPFGIMDDLIKSFEQFGRFDDENAFGGLQRSPFMIEPPGDDRSEKTDTDLDSDPDRAKLLLKDHDDYSSSGNVIVPQPSQPNIHHSFKSTSIVRVRKPDGTIEETKKYTDSTGREETVITTTEPSQDQDLNLPGIGFDQSRNLFGGFPFFSIFR